jgi:hypothetical protein
MRHRRARKRTNDITLPCPLWDHRSVSLTTNFRWKDTSSARRKKGLYNPFAFASSSSRHFHHLPSMVCVCELVSTSFSWRILRSVVRVKKAAYNWNKLSSAGYVIPSEFSIAVKTAILIGSLEPSAHVQDQEGDHIHQDGLQSAKWRLLILAGYRSSTTYITLEVHTRADDLR